MSQATPDILNDFHEALELFAYERLSLVKLGLSNIDKEEISTTYTTRLMLIVISALSKLAARWQPLTSRVVLCLAKILRHHQYFDKSVGAKANECVTLLKFPSIASSIFDVPHKSGYNLSHIDENSSLPFVTTQFEPGQRLHQFSY